MRAVCGAVPRAVCGAFCAFVLSCGAANAQGRHSHTITLLSDGNLLIIGGYTHEPGPGSTDSVKILISAEARFDTRDNLNVPRSSHTATLLPDGRVLVTGGISGPPSLPPFEPLNTAEIYDPRTDQWTTLASLMNSARISHTATLLKTGDVLVCGGLDGAAVTDSCDLFTPGPDSFAETTPLGWGRAGHTSTLLRTGQVFVAGGYNYITHLSTYIVTTEIYDTAGTWTPGPTLMQPRAFHTATALNTGNVLITGGYNGKNFRECLGYLESAEIYDVAANAIVPAASIPLDNVNSRMRITNHTATLMPAGDVSIRGGLGNVTTSYLDGGTIGYYDSHLDISALTLVIGDILGTSRLDFPLNKALGSINDPLPVNGIVVDGDVFFSPPPDDEDGNPTPSSTLEDANIFLAPSTASINGYYIKDGKLCGREDRSCCCPNPPFRLENPDGIIVFNPSEEHPDVGGFRVGSSKDFTIPAGPPSSQVDWVGGLADSGDTADIVPLGSTLTGTIVVDFPVSDIGGSIAAGEAKIVGGSITEGEYIDVELTGGTADLSLGGPIADLEDHGELTMLVTFNNLEGTVKNSTGPVSDPAGPLTSGVHGSIEGMKVGGLSIELRYVLDRVDMSDASFTFGGSTIVIRHMIFADDIHYDPSENSWSFRKTGMPVFNHTSLLSPNADVVDFNGLTCPALLPIAIGPGTGLYDCSSFEPASGGVVTIYQWKDEIPWHEGLSLNGPRGFHTSTLLPDGSILTTGGTNNESETLDSAEIYDPHYSYCPLSEEWTGKWVLTSSMTVPRSLHTATLLPNGTILVAGGYTVGATTEATPTAEIYYPDSENWVATASMTYARQNHTATLLPDGNVLVTGGSSSRGYLSSCEIYNSTMAVWTVADSLSISSRAQHTATLLHNGNVLVTGGVKHKDGVLDTCEIYNPAADTWAADASMNSARFWHTATLLRDGRVIVAGGDDGFGTIDKAEIYDPSAKLWLYTSGNYGINNSIGDPPGPYPPAFTGNEMIAPRLRHTTTLLPNGKLLIIGGAIGSKGNYSVLESVEGFDVDFSTWQPQGKMNSARSYHTTVLQADGKLLTIGGYDGVNYISSTEYLYFTTSPDLQGKEPKNRRPSDISTSPNIFEPGDSVTMLGKTPNFHGITEASGGGGGTTNSSFYHPRVYLQSIDNPSGYMIDLTSSVYYNGLNTWDKMASSITFIAPPVSSDLNIPYGWYHLRVAANAQFSHGCTVQISIPRPAGAPTNLTGTVMSSTTIVWNWNSGTMVPGTYDGWGIFSVEDNVFISTVSNSTTTFTQTGLAANTEASIKVGGYNLGGYGEFIPSATYYTYAATPKNLKVTAASFVSATLEWDANGNTGYTPYELSMAMEDSDFVFNVSIPLPFSVRHTTTSYTITYLEPNKMYYFRVRARNGDGIETEYDPPATSFPPFRPSVSTITVGQVTNLTGRAIATDQINWSWDLVEGADWYEIHDILEDDSVVWITSVTSNSFPQTGLSTNEHYFIAVKAVNDLGGGNVVKGPLIDSEDVCTLAAVPGFAPFSNIDTEGMIAHWISNGNPDGTWYVLEFSDDNFASYKLHPTTMTAYELDDLTPNTRYYGRVYAKNFDDIRSPPEPQTVSLGSEYTLARVPADLHPTEISISGVELEWDPNGNPYGTLYRLIQSTNNFTINVSTPISFLDNHTANTCEITGLLTSTTYYFRVMARHERTGTPTAAIDAVPTVFTLPGPSGTPPGSIAGLTDPENDVTIHGILPNGREVWIIVPASSFNSSIQIAISQLDTNPCNFQVGTDMHPISFGIYSTGGIQPNRPITIRFAYSQNEASRINSRVPRVVFARHIPVSNSCLPLETSVNKGLREIASILNHFSTFQLMEVVPRNNLDNIEIFPNPYYPNRTNAGYVTLKNLTGSAKIRIYTLSGVKVWEGKTESGTAYWNGKNSYGEGVASGVYLGVIEPINSSSKKKIVKIAVER